MTLHYSNAKGGLDALREAWKKVGTSRRGKISTCGICGCKSNLWKTYGNVMIGIKEFLVCPGREAYPEIHDKIERLRGTLWEDRLPDSTQADTETEIQRLLAKFAAVKPDIQNERSSNDQCQETQ